MNRIDSPNPQTEDDFEAYNMGGVVATVPDEEQQKEPNAFDWNSVEARDKKRLMKLEVLFQKFVHDLRYRAELLGRQSANRMTRYRFTRVAVVVSMLAALISLFYPDAKALGLEAILSKLSPAILGLALFFYILDAFLRDYEVASETARASERISRALRKAELQWVAADERDFEEHVRIVTDLTSVEVDVDSIIEAEKVRPFSDVRDLLERVSERSSRSEKPQNQS